MGRSLATATEMAGGNLQHATDRGIVKIAKSLRAEALRAFDLNMPVGFGQGLFSLWLEALATPGDDALAVRDQLKPLMDQAVEMFFQTPIAKDDCESESPTAASV